MYLYIYTLTCLCRYIDVLIHISINAYVYINTFICKYLRQRGVDTDEEQRKEEEKEEEKRILYLIDLFHITKGLCEGGVGGNREVIYTYIYIFI